MGQVLLVRHGQASWGAADYDVLSTLGERQASATGTLLKVLRPDAVVHGAMRRQQRTADLMVTAAEWDVVPVLEAAWDEMDHEAVLEAQPRGFDGEPDDRQFQAWFEKATRRWLSGDHDGDYAETWAGFRDRVLDGLESLVGARGDGVTVVVTSGGPISVVVAHLLESPAAYERIAPVVVNASVTKVVVGSRGRTLVSFNEHGHLNGELLTYR
jgi:broad specificity phosphatase PhoE